MKVILRSVHCHAKTESDEDEIYCVMTTGSGEERRQLARFDVGSFDVGTKLSAERLLWDGMGWPEVTITVMESDVNEPAYGDDDFIGEVMVSADGNCKPGHGTLDEGYDESKRFRQFSMTGSAAHYVVHLEIAA